MSTDRIDWTPFASREELAAEIERLQADLAACAAALPGPYYMDPPDGGDVPVSEQLQRMAADAARYRWLREGAVRYSSNGMLPEIIWQGPDWHDVSGAEKLDAAIDASHERGNQRAAVRLGK